MLQVCMAPDWNPPTQRMCMSLPCRTARRVRVAIHVQLGLQLAHDAGLALQRAAEQQPVRRDLRAGACAANPISLDFHTAVPDA